MKCPKCSSTEIDHGSKTAKCRDCEYSHKVEHFTATHYLLINKAGIYYTKDADYFREQGGLISEWGKHWEPIVAESMYDARHKGIVIRRKRYPNSYYTWEENE